MVTQHEIIYALHKMQVQISSFVISLNEYNPKQNADISFITFIVAPCISMIQSLLYSNLCTYIYIYIINH
jgi:hypothetical protein